MKIYTKTGDKGKTSLFDGTRVSKNNIRVETYGTVDELNSVIGMVVAEMSNKKLRIEAQKSKTKIKDVLLEIQNDLFDIGSMFADPRFHGNDTEEIGNDQSGKTYLESRVSEFEMLIDEMTNELPELANFILPGGGKTGALFHFARTVSRRTERKVIALSQEIEVQREVIMYFNRLSDLLFTLSRFVNNKEGESEMIWKKHRDR